MNIENNPIANKRLLAVLLLLVGVFAGVGVTVAQGKYRAAAAKGPYRVFISKPVVALGIKAGSMYREQEYVGALLNDLDRKGFVPIFTEIFTEQIESLRTDRLMLICRKR